MGDFRADIKIKLDLWGHKYSMDSWLNYSPEECCGMDKRVSDFFNESYEDAKSKYDDMVYEMDKENREKEEREHELSELKRLKQKYDTR